MYQIWCARTCSAIQPSQGYPWPQPPTPPPPQQAPFPVSSSSRAALAAVVPGAPPSESSDLSVLLSPMIMFRRISRFLVRVSETVFRSQGFPACCLSLMVGEERGRGRGVCGHYKWQDGSFHVTTFRVWAGEGGAVYTEAVLQWCLPYLLMISAVTSTR